LKLETGNSKLDIPDIFYEDFEASLFVIIPGLLNLEPMNLEPTN